MQSVDSPVIGFIEVDSPEPIEFAVLASHNSDLNRSTEDRPPHRHNLPMDRWSPPSDATTPLPGSGPSSPVMSFRLSRDAYHSGSVVVADLMQWERDLDTELRQLGHRIARFLYGDA